MKSVAGFLVLVLLAGGAPAAQAAGKPSTAMFHQSLNWSPDGKRIVFGGLHDYVARTDSYKNDVYLIDLAKGKQKQLSDDPDDNNYPAWSPDGTRIVFSTSEKGAADSAIYAMLADGSGLTPVSSSKGKNVAPAVSPDGKRIAFMSTRDAEKYQLYLMNADGSGVRRLLNDPATAYCNPEWSPDGKSILFYTDKGDQKDQIWMVNADGSNARMLTGGHNHNIFPGWSPDGTKIVFSARLEAQQDASYVDAAALYVMNADGSDPKPLAGIKSFFARYSPDGKKLAYVAGKFPQTGIYVVNADGTQPVKLTR